jgi:hypothetical protein
MVLANVEIHGGFVSTIFKRMHVLKITFNFNQRKSIYAYVACNKKQILQILDRYLVSKWVILFYKSFRIKETTCAI